MENNINTFEANSDGFARVSKKGVRVHLGLPVFDVVEAKTLASIIGVLITSPEKVTGYSMRISGDVVSARTFCVQDAIDKKATHIFFVDADMNFPPDTLERLLAHEKDIVTVEYNRRQLPESQITQPLEERSETQLYKARVIGGGCTLIKLDIFDKLAKPWFNFGRDASGKVVIGEDTWFARTAMDAGYDVWIDPTLKVGHIGTYIY